MQIRYEVMFVAIGLSQVLVQSRPRSAYYFTLEVLLLFRAMAKKDFTQVAFAVVLRATGEVVAPAPSKKQESARKAGLVRKNGDHGSDIGCLPIQSTVVDPLRM